MDDDIKDDGLKLIFEQSYTLENLRKNIKESVIAERCPFLDQSDEVEKICRGFLQLLKEELNLDEISSFFVAACMLYFIDAKPANSEWRTHLLQKAFCYVDTLSPMHLHVATKRLYDGLKLDGIAYVFNILSICNQITVASETGRAIANCLIWAIMCEITETEFNMYCFREFSQLIHMLSYIDDEVIQMEDSTQVVYILVQCIGFLTNSIVFGKNEDFKKAGYRPYFTYSLKDLKKLIEWADNLCNTMKVSVSKTKNYWDLRMAISEYVHSNISAVLQDKISDIQVTFKAV